MTTKWFRLQNPKKTWNLRRQCRWLDSSRLRPMSHWRGTAEQVATSTISPRTKQKTIKCKLQRLLLAQSSCTSWCSSKIDKWTHSEDPVQLTWLIPASVTFNKYLSTLWWLIAAIPLCSSSFRASKLKWRLHPSTTWAWACQQPQHSQTKKSYRSTKWLMNWPSLPTTRFSLEPLT